MLKLVKSDPNPIQFSDQVAFTELSTHADMLQLCCPLPQSLLYVERDIEEDNMGLLRVNAAIYPAQLRKVLRVCWFRVRDRARQKMARIDMFHLGVVAKEHFPAVDTDPHVVSNASVWLLLRLGLRRRSPFRVLLVSHGLLLLLGGVLRRVHIQGIEIEGSHEVDELVELEGADWNDWVEDGAMEEFDKSLLLFVA